MHRRQFFELIALGALTSSQACRASAQFARVDPCRGHSGLTPRSVSGCLRDRFLSLIAWMDQTGWSSLIARIAHITAPLSESALFWQIEPQRVGGFDDFGGCRLIEPGDPAMSLLYHALASPRVVLTEHGAPVGDDHYASQEQLDVLEDYIYALAPLQVPHEFLSDYALAVFAYEYRPASRVPHRRHADLVFSRTGLARIGSQSARYDSRHRCHRNAPIDGFTRDFAVTPARYALFLSRRASLDDVSLAHEESRDAQRAFLLPMRKIASFDDVIDGVQVHFDESHLNEKLRRFALHQAEGLCWPASVEFNLSRPPFTRRTRSSTDPSRRATRIGADQALVEISSLGSSALLSATPQPLVRPATQAVRGQQQRLRVRVPARRQVHMLSNRRYSTLKLLEFPCEDAVDFFLSDGVFGGGRPTTELHSPRNCPVFVNIRHVVREQDGAEISHLGLDSVDERRRFDEGGHWAGIFEDSICDGSVHAHLGEPRGTTALGSWLRSLPVLPAFSLVCAPDYFPRVDPGDFSRYDGVFLEGGSESLDSCRLPANINIRAPYGGGYSFTNDEGRSRRATLEHQVKTTIAATLSHRPAAALLRHDHDYERINTLPDSASKVFAPGWDATYSGVGTNLGHYYMSTQGLGSPFVEDMKLCAVANGMWVGASPDAARTFYASLSGVFTAHGSVRPPTAIPLLDDELGFHRDSPYAGGDARKESFGWDGEQGPFLEVSTTDSLFHVAGVRSRFAVNATDVVRSDYVRNALAGTLDASRLRNLSSATLIDRMRAYAACLRALPGFRGERYSCLWLVSAERVERWDRSAAGVGLPVELRAGARTQLNTSEGGYLYLFARVHTDALLLAARRNRYVCDSVYLCQVSSDRVAWCELNSEGDPFRSWVRIERGRRVEAWTTR
jgi:hypothetical protein